MTDIVASLTVSAILAIGLAQQSVPERHSLYYVYIALSKPIHAPGIFEFIAMGLLDDRKIDYYDSERKEKMPQQNWMKANLAKDYWEKGTQSRRSKEQWFKVNVNILMERLRQNNSDVHVLMWKHGCEVDNMPDGSVQFVRGVDAYSYDGMDFLSFDDASMQWIAPVPEALPTKQKWDGVPILNQYTKGYLEKECVNWLETFYKYGDQEMKEQIKASPPTVRLFAKETRSPDKLILTCMITGVYPKEIDINILKGGAPILKGDISDVLPNGDGTHQIRVSVEAEKSVINDYGCEINHRGLEKRIVRHWPSDGELICPGHTFTFQILGAVVGGLFVLLLIMGVIIAKIRSNGSLKFKGCWRERDGTCPENGIEGETKNEINGHVKRDGDSEKCSSLPVLE